MPQRLKVSEPSNNSQKVNLKRKGSALMSQILNELDIYLE